jgi:hypothetical protein
VRLCPGCRADILDLALPGMTADVDGIEQDYKGTFTWRSSLTTIPARIGARYANLVTDSSSTPRKWNPYPRANHHELLST